MLSHGLSQTVKSPIVCFFVLYDIYLSIIYGFWCIFVGNFFSVFFLFKEFISMLRYSLVVLLVASIVDLRVFWQPGFC